MSTSVIIPGRENQVVSYVQVDDEIDLEEVIAKMTRLHGSVYRLDLRHPTEIGSFDVLDEVSERGTDYHAIESPATLVLDDRDHVVAGLFTCDVDRYHVRHSSFFMETQLD